MRKFVPEYRQKQPNSRYHTQHPRSENTDRHQLSLHHPKATVREVHGNEPDAQEENDEPPKIDTNRDSVNSCNCDLVFDKPKNAHREYSLCFEGSSAGVD